MKKDAIHMNLVKTLLATTLTLAAASTFAAQPTTSAQDAEKVVVSTQEFPEGATQDSAAAQPNTAQPATEAAADAASTPVAQPQ
jgi:glycine betaine/choline ABC-type transport system substrate-binding protein